MRTRLVPVSMVLGLAMSCGGGGGGGPGSDADARTEGDGRTDVADASPDADNTNFTRLIGRTWNLAAGQPDTYRCVRLTMTEDVYVHSFRADSPLGTHHTVLGIASGSRGDGDYNCGPGDVGHNMLFASGVGTTDLTFPSGVAVKIAKGQQIVLNLHLYNASDDPLNNETAILVETLRPAEVQQEAEAVFAGRIGFTLAATRDPQPIDGGCAASRDYTLFALWPHMHQLGTHQTVTITSPGGEPRTLHDDDYSFFEQTYYLMQPEIQVKKDDRIDVRCTYVNTTEPLRQVGWGDGSDDEMCFTGLYRYPASGGNPFECSTGSPF